MGCVIDVSPAHFEELVAEALEAVPAELARLVDNVIFVIEADGPADDPDLLGLYIKMINLLSMLCIKKNKNNSILSRFHQWFYNV